MDILAAVVLDIHFLAKNSPSCHTIFATASGLQGMKPAQLNWVISYGWSVEACWGTKVSHVYIKSKETCIMLLKVWTIGSPHVSSSKFLSTSWYLRWMEYDGIPKCCASSATLLLWHSLVGHFPDQHSRTPHWEPHKLQTPLVFDGFMIDSSVQMGQPYIFWSPLLTYG